MVFIWGKQVYTSHRWFLITYLHITDTHTLYTSHTAFHGVNCVSTLAHVSAGVRVSSYVPVCFDLHNSHCGNKIIFHGQEYGPTKSRHGGTTRAAILLCPRAFDYALCSMCVLEHDYFLDWPCFLGIDIWIN